MPGTTVASFKLPHGDHTFELLDGALPVVRHAKGQQADICDSVDTIEVPFRQPVSLRVHGAPVLLNGVAFHKNSRALQIRAQLPVTATSLLAWADGAGATGWRTNALRRVVHHQNAIATVGGVLLGAVLGPWRAIGMAAVPLVLHTTRNRWIPPLVQRYAPAGLGTYAALLGPALCGEEVCIELPQSAAIEMARTHVGNIEHVINNVFETVLKQVDDFIKVAASTLDVTYLPRPADMRGPKPIFTQLSAHVRGQSEGLTFDRITTTVDATVTSPLPGKPPHHVQLTADVSLHPDDNFPIITTAVADPAHAPAPEALPPGPTPPAARPMPINAEAVIELLKAINIKGCLELREVDRQVAPLVFLKVKPDAKMAVTTQMNLEHGYGPEYHFTPEHGAIEVDLQAHLEHKHPRLTRHEHGVGRQRLKAKLVTRFKKAVGKAEAALLNPLVNLTTLNRLIVRPGALSAETDAPFLELCLTRLSQQIPVRVLVFPDSQNFAFTTTLGGAAPASGQHEVGLHVPRWMIDSLVNTISTVRNLLDPLRDRMVALEPTQSDGVDLGLLTDTPDATARLHFGRDGVRPNATAAVEFNDHSVRAQWPAPNPA